MRDNFTPSVYYGSFQKKGCHFLSDAYIISDMKNALTGVYRLIRGGITMKLTNEQKNRSENGKFDVMKSVKEAGFEISDEELNGAAGGILPVWGHHHHHFPR